MSIKMKILVGMIVMFFICVILTLNVLVITKKQKYDGLIINLAGRQRMLTQKMSKETLGLMYTFYKTREKDNNLVESLKKSIEVFDTTLRCLIYSGKAPITLNPHGPSKWIPGAKGIALKQLKKVESLWNPFKRNLDLILKSSELNKVDGSIKYILSHNIQLLKEMNKGVGLLQKQADKKVYFMQLTCIIGVLIDLIVLFGVLVGIQKTIVNPIAQLVNFAKEVNREYSENNTLFGEFDSNKDEIKTLKHVIDSMVYNLKNSIEEARALSEKSQHIALMAEEEKIKADEARKSAEEKERLLRKTAEDINEVSEKLVTTSDLLSSQSKEVLNNATIQKQRTQETATAMEEMNAAVLEVAKNASLAAENADLAREEAEKGGKVVEDTVSAMATIREMTDRLKENMHTLKSSAGSISEVITMISDIADQTNLLALNAAIEAARAGEAGRGFAVVADEVRKLAEKTMMATKEVISTIDSIQKEVNKNVEEIDRVVESVGKGNELSMKSKEVLQQIVGLVISIAEQIRSIATAAEQQSASSEEITRSISEIDQLSDITLKDTENTQQTIKELANMASELKDMVNKMIEN